MRRIGGAFLGGMAVVAAVWLAVYHGAPREAGDAATDYAADESMEEPVRPGRVVPVLVDPGGVGARPRRLGTDPGLDTGSAARADEGAI